MFCNHCITNFKIIYRIMEDYIELYSGLNASILVLSLFMTFARTLLQ